MSRENNAVAKTTIQSLGKLTNATNTLNRNIEASVAGQSVPIDRTKLVRKSEVACEKVGMQFGSVSTLWKSFEDCMRGTKSSEDLAAFQSNQEHITSRNAS